MVSGPAGSPPDELPYLAAMDAAPLAVIATDLQLRAFYANEAAERLYGHPREVLLDASVMGLLVRPVDEAAALEVVTTVLSGQVWSGEFAVTRPDGSLVSVFVDDVPLWRDGKVVGIVGIGRESADRVDPHSAVLLAGLGRVTAELAGADDASAVAHLVVEQAADAFGADSASLSLLHDDGLLHLEALRGGTPDARERYATYAVDECSPVGEAVHRGELVSASGADEIHSRWPDLATLPGERSIIAVPLVVGARRLGGVSLSFGGRRTFSAVDRLFLRTLADTAAQALTRVESADVAAERARKLAFLGEASVELASSLDYQTTLNNVAKLALRELADWVGVELVDDGRLLPVVTQHRDPAMIELAREMRRRYPTPLDSETGVPAVIRTGRSMLYPYVPEEALVEGARDADHLDLIRRLRLVSVMMVPLAVRDRVLGALVLISSDPSRLYGEEDLAFAEDLARRAAVAIDNSHLYSQTLEASVRLQHALLPESLPDTAHWELAVHYRPAGRTEVGGDFYDALRLPDGRLVAVVGDVMGRGVGAAAAMAQLRASLRAFVAQEPDPACALTELTAMYDFYGMGGLATVVLGLLDAAAGTVTLATAGHLPPVIVDAAGGTRVIVPPVSPPLGVGSFARSSVCVPFAPGDVVLLYTDGLVETREQDLDAGIERLVGRLRTQPPPVTGDRLRDLAADLVPPGQDDDVTLLAVRRRDTSAASAHL